MDLDFFKDSLDLEILKLDEFQKVFVKNDSQILSVLANAGSGKTHSSIVKVLNNIINKDLCPSDIVCISYTNKASKVLRDRYTNFFVKNSSLSKKEISLEIGCPWMSTIHSFCFNLLNKKLKSFDSTWSFSILNDNKSLKVLSSSFKDVFKEFFDLDITLESNVAFALYHLVTDIGNCNEYGMFVKLNISEDFSLTEVKEDLDLDRIDFMYCVNNGNFNNSYSSKEECIKNQITSYVSRLENILVSSKKIPEFILNRLNQITLKRFLSSLISNYLKSKFLNRGLSFIDIIYLTFEYNLKYKSLGENFKLAIIDEAQDIDYVNFFMFKTLFDYFKCKLIFVGDPKQSLYAFRFADPYILDRLPSFFNDNVVEVLYLLSNYRSNENLVEFANKFSDNLSNYFSVKNSHSVKPKSKNVFSFRSFEKIDLELEYITSDILIKKERYGSFKNIVCLSRTNQNLLELEPFLIKKRIPYRIKYDANSLVNQSSFKFIYSLYCVLSNNRDIDSFLDLLEFIKGVGDKSLSKIKSIFNLRYLNKGVLDKDFLFEITSSLKLNSIIGFTNTYLFSLNSYFKSYEFSVLGLNKLIFENLINNFSYLSYNDDGSLKYINLDNSLGSVSINFFQFQKAISTMSSLYDSYLTDVFFNNLSEIERFFEVLSSLSSTQIDKESDDRDSILVSTVHGFKGLESECVYYFMASSLSAFIKSDTLNDLCVMYVASTRAISEFILTYSLMLRSYDKTLRKAILNPYVSMYLEGVKSSIKS